MEQFQGKDLPEGWTRVRTGEIRQGDRALAERGQWFDLPDRYVGALIGLFVCVIRKVDK